MVAEGEVIAMWFTPPYGQQYSSSDESKRAEAGYTYTYPYYSGYSLPYAPWLPPWLPWMPPLAPAYWLGLWPYLYWPYFYPPPLSLYWYLPLYYWTAFWW
ncbi:MAG: hypothetical protein DRJ68_02720 [Thermoprotei archaeon]|nr:MAG: hypothetical protein DRJ68_02720 [Thermoprotei archaeon]